MMKFRKWLFYILALIALLWIGIGWNMSSANYVDLATADPDAAIGYAVGSGIGFLFFVCTGVPFFLFFGLLGWRNSVGLREERRHQELMDLQTPPQPKRKHG